MTGRSRGSGTSEDYATIAYDAATGAVVWARRYGAEGYDSAESLATAPDGRRLFVTGDNKEPGGYNDYATIAYDAATGVVLWVRRYDGPSHQSDSASSVAVSPDGAVFVTGSSAGPPEGVADYATIAYDP